MGEMFTDIAMNNMEEGVSPGHPSEMNNGVQLTFKNIVYKVTNKRYKKQHSLTYKMFNHKKMKSIVPESEKELTILHGVSGVIERGELVALMGPSGSGKSTLLDILAKRKSSGHITGQLLVNGKEIGEAYKNYCSYVTQEDILLPTATVEETLRFYADLRLSDASDEYKQERIRAVLEDIGLAKKASSKIGGMLPGGIQLRGLSGGEKRRVSIGCGLVTNPSLIFLDEPTSGLDSVNALVVMKTLMNLCTKGVTVICSIHQPRPEIWRLFNKVMVVVKGRMIYSGSDILSYFDSLGFPTPPHVNPADFCLDAAVEIGESSRYIEICERWQQHWETEVNTAALPPVEDQQPRRIPSWAYQYQILLKRAFRDFLRNPGNFVARTITGVIVGLLFGACFGGLGETQVDIQKIIGVIFFLISGLNLTPYAVISLFLSGRALFNQERAAKIYHPIPYFLSMLTVENIVVVIIAILMAGITYAISHLRWSVGRFFFSMLVFYFVHLFSDLCIILLTNLTGTSDHTFAIGAGLSVVYQLFAGFFVPVQQLPKSFAFLHYLNPLFYAFASLMVNEFEDRPLVCPPEPQPCQYPNGNDVIKAFGLDNWTRADAFGVTVMWTVVFFILSYLALTFLHKEKR
ncbi:ABC transporter G family protein [Heterostelium album PN500]|uniref:ABC transporter G family protein n=1 Tax=Heterostelium pallidum (strain ATCC 26659 / Pp 5 / PN500) TaxID=670386 RepID=D3B1K0_HETP5|nr:ABC transporter G family protein [Heterostelium album PN500]EFA85174.1 ABC transporter G family protein [Heterostelium album PN500]|eukprot:XP_020437283.1 ABC transporter G family protein [Heterostelium album PN500]